MKKTNSQNNLEKGTKLEYLYFSQEDYTLTHQDLLQQRMLVQG